MGNAAQSEAIPQQQEGRSRAVFTHAMQLHGPAALSTARISPRLVKAIGERFSERRFDAFLFCR